MNDFKERHPAAEVSCKIIVLSNHTTCFFKNALSSYTPWCSVNNILHIMDYTWLLNPWTMTTISMIMTTLSMTMTTIYHILWLSCLRLSSYYRLWQMKSISRSLWVGYQCGLVGMTVRNFQCLLFFFVLQ